MERRGGRIGGMIGLLLVQAAADYWRLDRKPPVTAGLVAANTLIYLRPKFLNRFLPTIDQVLFNPYLILKNKDLKRFILSAFYHIGEPHLVYNMLSLLWKGIQLENQMGSVEFASMVAALLGMSQGITLLLAKTLLLFDYDEAYYYEYSAGFSGVLFAMKVILYSQSDNYANIHGIMVPARYAAWAELILVQMLVPGVSFLGHLGGVLAGILYLYLKSSRSGPNPVMKVFMGLVRTVTWPLRSVVGTFASSGSRFFGRGVVGRQGTSNSSAVWRCSVCTYDNSGLLSACEMCGSERADEDEWSTTSPENLSVEELRRRRVQRFIG